MRAAAALLIGVDLVKPAAVLEAAYDDALGVTAAFNLNLLRHLNRVIGSDFDPRSGDTSACFDERASRIEMHLQARAAARRALARRRAPLRRRRTHPHRVLVQVHAGGLRGPAARRRLRARAVLARCRRRLRGLLAPRPDAPLTRGASIVTVGAPSWATLPQPDDDCLALAATAAAAAASAASAPLWTLDGLRAADPVLGLALLMLVAMLLAETLHRAWRLPRICGHMLTGAIAGPLMLRLLDGLDLDPWKPLIDLAIGALLFELGTRIRPRWLLDNRWLAAELPAAGRCCAACSSTGALVWLGAPWLSAAVAGTVALSTSPVIVLAVAHESRARGQVTERLLMMTAINAVIAVLGLKVLRIVLASDSRRARRRVHARARSARCA